jgi:hypothetical protein
VSAGGCARQGNNWRWEYEVGEAGGSRKEEEDKEEREDGKKRKGEIKRKEKCKERREKEKKRKKKNIVKDNLDSSRYQSNR